MKNKIKSFIDQCTKTTYVGIIPRHHGSETVFDHEKFAQLIVKECSRWIKSQDEADHPTAWLLCDELEKHFGVKS